MLNVTNRVMIQTEALLIGKMRVWETLACLPTKVTLCLLKTVKITHFVTIACAAVPFFALQKGKIFVVGLEGEPPPPNPPPKMTLLSPINFMSENDKDL